MVNAELVKTIADHLAVSGRVFVQTDIEFLAEEIFELFEANNNFERIDIAENPFPVKTEREAAVEEKNLPIYRTIFLKSQGSK